MKPWIMLVRRMVLVASLGGSRIGPDPLPQQTSEAVRIVELRGVVEILPHGAANWVLTQTNQPLYPLDRVRTRANSSVGLLLSDQSVLRFDAMSELEIQPEPGDADQGLHLLDGILSFFHRGKPGRIHVIASGGLAGVEGTEFVMASARPMASSKPHSP
jgi:ferric-dicitrate binding protein FerR (iron transport regulator)